MWGDGVMERQQQQWLAMELKYDCEGFLLDIIEWPDFRRRIVQHFMLIVDYDGKSAADDTPLVISKSWWNKIKQK